MRLKYCQHVQDTGLQEACNVHIWIRRVLFEVGKLYTTTVRVFL